MYIFRNIDKNVNFFSKNFYIQYILNLKYVYV